jgi:hypothetical protein
VPSTCFGSSPSRPATTCSGTGGVAVSASVALVWRRTCREPLGMPAALLCCECLREALGMDRAAELVAEDEIVVVVGVSRQIALEDLRLPVPAEGGDRLGVERDRSLRAARLRRAERAAVLVAADAARAGRGDDLLIDPQARAVEIERPPRRCEQFAALVPDNHMTSVRHTARRVRGDGACWLPSVGCLAQMCSRRAESLIGGSRCVRCAMRCRRRLARRPGGRRRRRPGCIGCGASGGLSWTTSAKPALAG